MSTTSVTKITKHNTDDHLLVKNVMVPNGGYIGSADFFNETFEKRYENGS